MKVEAVSRHEVITVGRQATVAEAARTMGHHHVGDLIVDDPGRDPDRS